MSVRGRAGAVEVWASDFAYGRLPPFCVVTGRPATGWEGRLVRNDVGAEGLSILAGIVPFMVVQAMVRKEIGGVLPVDIDAARTFDDFVRRRWTAAAVLVMSVTVVVLAAIYGQADRYEVGSTVPRWCGLLGVSALVAAMVALYRVTRTPTGRVRCRYVPERAMVVISGANPVFVEAARAAHTVAPAGWYPDPSGRWPGRYWDGRAWTAHVEAPGTVGLDPLGGAPDAGTAPRS